MKKHSNLSITCDLCVGGKKRAQMDFLMSCQRDAVSEPFKIHEYLSQLLEEKLDMDDNEDYSECPLCERTYRTKYLVNHMKKVHPPDYETVVCQICQKSYKTKNHLHDHIRKIHNTNSDCSTRKSAASKQECQQCGKIFANKHYLQTHILRVHNKTNNMKFECDYCHKTFTYKELIQKHIMSVHCDTKMIRCGHCSKHYKSSYINEHKRRVHPIGDGLECDICHKKYKTKRLFRVHMQKTHESKYTKKIYKIYNKNYNSKDKGKNKAISTVQLKENLSRVKDIGFECSHCNHTFKEKILLLRHLRALLKKEIFEELDFDEPENNLKDTTSYHTRNLEDIINCNNEDSKNKDNSEGKSDTPHDMFMDADNFLLEIKQEIKSEIDLEIGPVILQRPDYFNTL